MSGTTRRCRSICRGMFYRWRCDLTEKHNGWYRSVEDNPFGAKQRFRDVKEWPRDPRGKKMKEGK